MTATPGRRLPLLVLSRLLPEVQDDLRAAFDVTFADAIPARADGFEALLVSLENPLDARAIESLPEGIRAIATYSVGTDHIDCGAARERGIAVFNTPGVLAEAVAENAIFLMLGAARRATESIALIRSGAWQGWSPVQLVGTQISGKRLGILGMGDIGTRVAHRARAFGMEILYCNRRALDSGHPVGGSFRPTPAALAADSDVLLLACPSTPETRGIVDAKLLEAARPGSILVNIARGDLVVDDDLIAALRSGHIRAAGLDVFAGEPQVNPDYFELPNVFMLPHIGSSTMEARRGMGAILIAALESWRRGEHPKNQIC